MFVTSKSVVNCMWITREFDVNIAYKKFIVKTEQIYQTYVRLQIDNKP